MNKTGRVAAIAAWRCICPSLSQAGHSLQPEPKPGARGQTGKTSKIATVESGTITVRIGRPFDELYDFLANPENWNQWARTDLANRYGNQTMVGLPTRMAEQPRFDSRRGIASAFSIIT